MFHIDCLKHNVLSACCQPVRKEHNWHIDYFVSYILLSWVSSMYLTPLCSKQLMSTHSPANITHTSFSNVQLQNSTGGWLAIPSSSRCFSTFKTIAIPYNWTELLVNEVVRLWSPLQMYVGSHLAIRQENSFEPKCLFVWYQQCQWFDCI